MTTTSSRLDADELLHIAINAAKLDRHEEAIDCLKRAIEIEPAHAKAHYFLAAEHAQIGLYDRAIEEMQKAVEIDPSLETAHFQLGLLHLTSGRVNEAIAAWKPLEALGEANPLFLFKQGLECMAADKFEECRAYLTKGMELNRANTDLNNDMQRVLDALPAAAGETEQVPTDQGGHVFLSAYAKNDDDN